MQEYLMEVKRPSFVYRIILMNTVWKQAVESKKVWKWASEG
jgi:hypothetical protein